MGVFMFAGASGVLTYWQFCSRCCSRSYSRKYDIIVLVVELVLVFVTVFIKAAGGATGRYRDCVLLSFICLQTAY